MSADPILIKHAGPAKEDRAWHAVSTATGLLSAPCRPQPRVA